MRIFIASLLVLLLSSCTPTQLGKAALGAVLPSKSGISASAQVGKENQRQTGGVVSGRDVVLSFGGVPQRPVEGPVGTINNIDQGNNYLWIIALIVALFLDSPNRIFQDIFRRKK